MPATPSVERRSICRATSQPHSVTTPLSPATPIPSLCDTGRATQVALERGGRVDVLQRDECTYSHSQMPQASSFEPDSTPRSRLLEISSKFHTNIYSPSPNVALFLCFRPKTRIPASTQITQSINMHWLEAHEIHRRQRVHCATAAYDAGTSSSPSS